MSTIGETTLVSRSGDINPSARIGLGSLIILPNELILKIFSFLNLATVGASCRVSKDWNALASDEGLRKKMVYREIAFGNAKWARCFGKDVVEGEDRKEEYASLPWKEFIADCQKITDVFPGKKGRECLMLVRLPKTLNGGLTLNSLGQLAKKYFPTPTGYEYIYDQIVAQLGDKPIETSYWVIMTKDVLPGSREQTYVERQRLVSKLAEKALHGYKVPGLLEATTCILAHYFDSQLFSDNPITHTSCQEVVNGYRTIVGGCTPFGLRVDYYDSFIDGKSVGVLGLRKF